MLNYQSRAAVGYRSGPGFLALASQLLHPNVKFIIKNGDSNHISVSRRIIGRDVIFRATENAVRKSPRRPTDIENRSVRVKTNKYQRRALANIRNDNSPSTISEFEIPKRKICM